MRTTIIPAQITTVEDKIAGSFNLAQILILMMPVLWTTLVYVVLAPTMKLVSYKLIMILIVTLLCVILALRIKGKIVAEWLGILLNYQLRPKYYLFNKNDLTGRILDIPLIPKIHTSVKKLTHKPIQTDTDEIDVSDLIKLEQLIHSGKVALRYQFEGKRS